MYNRSLLCKPIKNGKMRKGLEAGGSGLEAGMLSLQWDAFGSVNTLLS